MHTPGPDPPTPGLFPMDSSSQDLRATRSGSTASQRGLLGRSSSASLSVPREEIALQRAELDDVKKENEMLKTRIRELEGLVRARREEREANA
jgi:cell division protein FtsB